MCIINVQKFLITDMMAALRSALVFLEKKQKMKIYISKTSKTDLIKIFLQTFAGNNFEKAYF